jgi:hypothetical protein
MARISKETEKTDRTVERLLANVDEARKDAEAGRLFTLVQVRKELGL